MHSKLPLLFIAHSHRDSEAALALIALIEYAFDRKVDTFCTSKPRDKIRNVRRLPPFRDERGRLYQFKDDVLLGDRIAEAMAPAGYVVVLHTPQSMGRDWVQLETDIALIFGRPGRRAAICLAQGACWGDHAYHEKYNPVFDLSYLPSALLFVEDVAKWFGTPLIHSDIDPNLSLSKID